MIGEDFVFIVRQVDRLFVYQNSHDADFYFKALAFSETQNIQNQILPESIHPHFKLLHGNRLGQIPRLINIAATHHGNIIRK